MIGKITGRVAHRAADHVLVETASGLGYEVHCSELTLAALPGDQTVALFTQLVVREDQWQLYGFETLEDREWHRLLTSVQGVGAKAGMAILGTLGAAGVSRAITLGDAAAIKAAPGVGPKLAARVVNELKDKAAGAMVAQVAAAAPVIDTGPGSSGAMAEAVSALINLGYPQTEAATAVASASEDTPDANTGELIRIALKSLAKS